MMKSKHLVASFLYTHADILIKIVFDAEPRPDIPVIYIRIKRTDMVYVLQVRGVYSERSAESGTRFQATT